MELTIPCNHLCMLEITPVDDKTDTYLGYDPEEFYGMVWGLARSITTRKAG